MSEPETDQDDEFTAGQRRRKLISAIVAVVGVAAIATFVLVRRANRLPALDPDDVREVREALDKIPPEYRRELAAAAFVDLEGERIPGALLESFKAFNNAPPDMVELVLLRSIADDSDVRSAWLLACPDGLNVLAEAGTSGAGAQHVYERCELSRFGLIGDSELGGASMGALVITHAAWAHLVEHDSETDLERRLLRTVLGRS